MRLVVVGAGLAGLATATYAIRTHPDLDVRVLEAAASPANQAANLDVFDFALDDAEMRRVFALARGERLVDDPSVDWEEG